MEPYPPPVPESENIDPAHPPQPGMGLKIATALVTVFSFVILVATARIKYGSGTESQAIGYVIGGIVFWPGLMTAIFSLSKKHRSPRRSCRTWLITTSVIVCLNMVTFFGSLRRAEVTHNREVFESLQSASVETLEELVETDDLGRLAELQKQSFDDLEDSVAALDGDAHQSAALAMECMRPILRASENYTAAAAKFFTRFEQALQAESVEGLEALPAPLERLITQHDALIVLIEDFEPNAKIHLAQSGLSRSAQLEIFRGLKMGFDQQLPYLQKVRRSDADMLNLYPEWIELLSSRWLEWERDEDGVFLWSTDEGLAAHNEITEALVYLAAEQAEAQRGLLDVVQGGLSRSGG